MHRSPSMHIHCFVRPAGNTGFLILDTLIAMAILAGGFLSFAYLQVQILDLGGRTKSHTEALRLAEGRMEELRYAMIHKRPDEWVVNGEEVVPGAQSTMHLHWSVPEDRDTRDRPLVVTVSWNTKDDVRNITFGSRVARVEPLPENLLTITFP